MPVKALPMDSMADTSTWRHSPLGHLLLRDVVHVLCGLFTKLIERGDRRRSHLEPFKGDQPHRRLAHVEKLHANRSIWRVDAVRDDRPSVGSKGFDNLPEDDGSKELKISGDALWRAGHCQAKGRAYRVIDKYAQGERPAHWERKGPCVRADPERGPSSD